MRSVHRVHPSRRLGEPMSEAVLSAIVRRQQVIAGASNGAYAVASGPRRNLGVAASRARLGIVLIQKA
jgi:hypothetical protein